MVNKMKRGADEAVISSLTIEEVSTDPQWQIVREFRQKYFFDKVPIADPYTWTFHHPDHLHFILNQHSIIIGYAHVQLWPEKRAALRIIVVDENHRHKGMGGFFLKYIEKNLKRRGVEELQIQSSPEAYRFYEHHNYHKMPFNDPDNHGSDPQDVEIGKIL